jgi:hypothetical protein
LPSAATLQNASYFASDQVVTTTTSLLATPRRSRRLAIRKRHRCGDLPYGKYTDVIEKAWWLVTSTQQQQQQQQQQYLQKRSRHELNNWLACSPLWWTGGATRNSSRANVSRRASFATAIRSCLDLGVLRSYGLVVDNSYSR